MLVAHWKKHKRAPSGDWVHDRRKAMHSLVREGRVLKVSGKFIPII